MNEFGRIVVTGAQTALGRRVVSMLLERGHAVIALVENRDDVLAFPASAPGLSVRRFDLLVAEDEVPPVHGPAMLVHLAHGRDMAEHLAKARTARLLAAALGAGVVVLGAPEDAVVVGQTLSGARRLAETILCDGAEGVAVVVRAGLLDEDLRAGAAAPDAGRFRFLTCRGWTRIAVADRDPVARAVVNAVEAAPVAGTVMTVAAPVRGHVRAWRLRRPAS